MIIGRDKGGVCGGWSIFFGRYLLIGSFCGFGIDYLMINEVVFLVSVLYNWENCWELVVFIDSIKEILFLYVLVVNVKM